MSRFPISAVVAVLACAACAKREEPPPAPAVTQAPMQKNNSGTMPVYKLKQQPLMPPRPPQAVAPDPLPAPAPSASASASAK